ncbi:MAG: CinA family protein [Lachnospiraceae bacterium]|nr:CinA family protein [Lachnospiraceae bacterium]
MAAEEYLVKALKRRNMTVTTVESCTGGMIAARLTSVPGSSEVFHRGFVTYCDQAKHEMVGVRRETLEKHTAVSRETAREMAEGGAREAKADCCVSVTGYAGPDSGGGEPVGLVYIGCYFDGETEVEEHRFSGDRNAVRAQAAERALNFLKEKLD